MSTLVVNGRFLGRPVSGVERHAHSVLAALDHPRVHVPPARLRRGAPGHLWEQAILPGKVRRGDVLWSPCNFGPAAVRRQIVTVHDIAPLDHPEWFSARYRTWTRTMLQLLTRRGVHFATVSPFTADRLLDRLRLSSDRVTVVGNGVDVDRFAARAGADVPFADLPDGFVLAVASLEPRKNVARLLAAARLARRRGVLDAPLVLAGAFGTGRVFGTGTDDLRRELAGAAADGTVRVLGHVDDATLGSLYRRAGAVAYVSLYEGFGLPPLEAAVCGARVVVSDIPPLRATLDGYATFVDPSSVESIAHGLATCRETTPAARPQFSAWSDCAQRLEKCAAAMEQR